VTERAKILLVDDRPENLLALEAILDSLDLDLVRAGSGEEALRALLKAEFALILLDAQMPGMDGFETAVRIKRRIRTKDVPIIFVTANDQDPNSSYRGYVAGGADYISKPFDPWILRAKVQVFVDLWAARRPSTSAAAPRGHGDGHEELLGTIRERFAALEAEMRRLESELRAAEVSPAARAAVERVDRRLDSFREAVDGLGDGTEALSR
jgi:CheY-like chemotaxis protein/uncharacterized small protein (DUF1192 family)